MADMEVVGGMKFISTEMMEWLYPLLVEQCEIEPDSHGPGKWRGAPGVSWRMITYESSPLEVYPLGQHDNVTYGVLGGKPGVGNVTFIFDPKNSEKRTFFSVCGSFAFLPGWVYGSIASGGGGYGDPLERDPELVRIDVRDEIVSVAGAKKDYGVILDPHTYQIDHEATERLRAKIRERRGELPLVSPTEPGGTALRHRMMTEKDDYVDLDRSPDALP